MSKTTSFLLSAWLLAAATHTGAQQGTEGEEEQVLQRGALAEAARDMEQQADARVLEIRLVDETGTPAFEAAMAKDGSVIYLRLDQPAENLVEIDVAELPPWMAEWKVHEFAQLIERAKVPLADAIEKAESQDDAPAVGAGLAEPLEETGNPALAYYVELRKGRESEVLALDAMRGKFIENPERIYTAWTPVRLARRLAGL